MMDTISQRSVAALFLCILMCACGKKEAQQPVAVSVGAPPTSIAPIASAEAARLKSEGKANDLGFCLAALQAELKRSEGVEQEPARPLQEQLQKILPEVDKLKSRHDSAAKAFEVQFDTMSKKLNSKDQCGALQCRDAAFRQYVISSSCPG